MKTNRYCLYVGLLVISLFAGCDDSTDENNAGVDDYFASNPYVSGDREEPDDSIMKIAPSKATIRIVGEEISFTATGGDGDYHWYISNEEYGRITLGGANQAIYICLRIGNNTIICRDGSGHGATAAIIPVTDTMSISPSSITLALSEGELYASFSVSGGTPPYSWNVGNASLGTVSYSADATEVCSYRAVAGAYGKNTVTVKDGDGRTATATITQAP
jgi:hypothetical protein